MFEIQINRRTILNEQGSAFGGINVYLKNVCDEIQDLTFLEMKMSNADIIVDRVEFYENDEIVPYTRETKEGLVYIKVDLRGITLPPNLILRFIMRFNIPALAKKFDNQYFIKETFFHVMDNTKACSWTIKYEIPRFYDKWKVWKEMDIKAPDASEIENCSSSKQLTYHFVLENGGKKEVSFMFQERNNSTIVKTIVFLLGIGFTQLGKWVISLIFE
ncbi:MAG: hypothetical protein QCH99_00320 [Candidatus Bathyarchaeota archaeon]|nr:hypothetical protein [Candidatus Bathyarchaeum tardum]